MNQAGTAEPGEKSQGAPIAGALRFIEALRARMDERRADGGNLALLLIDCGVVGKIDAAWGYHVGDAVHSRFASALRADVLRPSDLLGDLGHDEFACVLSPVDGQAVALLAAEKSLRALGNPVWIGDDEIYARPSIGIAMYAAHGVKAESLLQQAKRACAVARGDPSHVAVHSEDQENPEESQLLYANRMRAAVTEDTFDLAFQPQYDLQLGQIMGVEALLRGRNLAPKLIPSEDAFSAAESAGYVTKLLSSILNRALRNCSELRFSAGLDLRIAVNVPGRALRHAELPEVVARALGTWNLRPGRLVIEIGETSILDAEPLARETLARLNQLGVKLSIDDPGLTISSLFWLANLPFQEIKIDLARALELPGESKSEYIQRAIIELAHNLELEVVALNVADDTAAARLKQLGCDYMQADYRGAALGPEAFIAKFGLNES